MIEIVPWSQTWLKIVTLSWKKPQNYVFVVQFMQVIQAGKDCNLYLCGWCTLWGDMQCRKMDGRRGLLKTTKLWEGGPSTFQVLTLQPHPCGVQTVQTEPSFGDMMQNQKQTFNENFLKL